MRWEWDGRLWDEISDDMKWWYLISNLTHQQNVRLKMVISSFLICYLMYFSYKLNDLLLSLDLMISISYDKRREKVNYISSLYFLISVSPSLPSHFYLTTYHLTIYNVSWLTIYHLNNLPSHLIIHHHFNYLFWFEEMI